MRTESGSGDPKGANVTATTFSAGAAGTATLPRPPRDPDGEALLRSARVLVVEDQPAARARVSGMLRRAGVAEVISVTNSREALSAFLRCAPDLVLLDLHERGTEGDAVLRALQEVCPSDTLTPVVVVTGAARVVAGGHEPGRPSATLRFDPAELLARMQDVLATRALYDRLALYTRQLEQRVEAHLDAERRSADEHHRRRRRIEDVIDRRTLHMVFQPIVDLDSNRVVGVEALARFDGEPDRAPNLWFAEAAEVGLATELELMAADIAFRSMAELPADIYLSINLSPETLCSPQLLDAVGVWGSRRLVIEITEHTAVYDYDQLEQVTGWLRSRGIRIAVDDAGSGFSSLQHILRLRPDIIKLDMALTRGIDGDPVRRALASSLVTFSGEIDAELVAEGLETGAEVAALRNLGVRGGQGYWLGPPAALPQTPATALLRPA